MPELPDVESFRKYFLSTAMNKKIKNVNIMSTKILGSISSRSLQKYLKGSKFISNKRHGKNLFAGMNNNKWLLLHFGMTGFLKYYKNEDEKPDYTRLLINFENGYHLAFDNVRKLGKIDVINDIDEYIEKKKLGPDPLEDNLSFEDFYDILKDRKGSIKSTLMNQKVIAGIGNIYSDEILFQSGIHPASSVNGLNENNLKNIYKKMVSVLGKAVAVNADADKFPRTYLLPHREGGNSCPKCSGKIVKKMIGGRSSYLCNKHQKKK
jgi:formamidopyrimidine-DNA glycosylase